MTGEAPHTLLQRYGTAFAVSIVCHAIFFAGILRRMPAVGATPTVITITLRAGDGGAAGGAGGAGDGTTAAGGTGGAPAAGGDGGAPPHTELAAAAVDPAPPRPATESGASHELPAPQRPTMNKSQSRSRADRTRTLPHDAPRIAPPAESGRARVDEPAVASADGRTHDADAVAADSSASRGDGIAGGADTTGTGAGHGEGVARGAGAGDGSGSGIGGDLRARCLACPTPVYPSRARRQGWQGTVDVTLDVAADGKVETAQVGRSSGFSVLDTAAVEVARRSRFHVAEHTTGLHGVLRYRFVLQEPRAAKSF